MEDLREGWRDGDEGGERRERIRVKVDGRDGNETVGHDDGGIRAGGMKQLTCTAGWIISTSVSPSRSNLSIVRHYRALWKQRCWGRD